MMIQSYYEFQNTVFAATVDTVITQYSLLQTNEITEKKYS